MKHRICRDINYFEEQHLGQLIDGVSILDPKMAFGAKMEDERKECNNLLNLAWKALCKEIGLI